MKRRLLPWLTMALSATALVAVSVAPARTSEAAGPSATPAKATAPAGGAFKVALVTDIGGLNDRSFNFLANKGRLRVQNELGVQTRVFITTTAADRIPNLRTAAQQGYDLVIGVGFLMAEPLSVVAKAFPNTKFAGVDVAWETVKGGPKNVRGLLFKEQEAGYLAGYLAGLQVVRKPAQGEYVVGAVGAIKIPPIVRYLAGYYAGARKADPRIKVLINYAQDSTFSDQAKCKEQALNQIANNAGVVFQVAGQCGLGVLSAAKEKGVFGIGVDADQGYIGPHVLTSAIKKVDVAVFLTAQAAKAQGSRFRGGYNATFSIKNSGVGYGRVTTRVPKSDVAKVEAIRKQIVSGKIRVPANLPAGVG
ncbi:MAG: BMP family ABC transporter substrate-binding protein [Actinobacteria bacterium]|nr:BMP family ABC transporter substrate-binding protein [Actinomycetota bacterium]